MFLKICANTNAPDACLAAELGADAVGFVFAPSKRQVTTTQVAEITRLLPGSVEKIGIFPLLPAGEIIEAVKAARLTGVQLHGALAISLIEELTRAFEGRVKLIQVIGFEVDPQDVDAAHARFAATLHAALELPELSAILIDTIKSGSSGGLGTPFDWAAAADLIHHAYDHAGRNREELPKLILAGGLNSSNVAQAIHVLHPDGVDVASGVESAPGTKDPAKIRAFITIARNA